MIWHETLAERFEYFVVWIFFCFGIEWDEWFDEDVRCDAVQSSGVWVPHMSEGKKELQETHREAFLVVVEWSEV